MSKAFAGKPLRDHTLLQAMCRTNRLYDADDGQKQMGLIVGYLGVFENLPTALAYNLEGIEGVAMIHFIIELDTYLSAHL